ncbi:hypothetical protein DKX38_012650 [Salix brachista]|uniref:Uncharacterized protein n=1 Tax=Salix brachista TaxID=2182728 RepID=A0A5N5LPM8_9ROSI|nr:hypothetical protein DKX38_012650 [Salix brachista]
MGTSKAISMQRLWLLLNSDESISMQRLWLLLNSDESLVFCRNVTGMRNITFFGIIMGSYIQEKIRKFEQFVDGHLKPQLVRVIAERHGFISDLRMNIENLEKNSVTNLRTMVNLGSEVYMQADVPDTQRIFVDVGLGFHVEFTWTEALSFIALREEKIAGSVRGFESCSNCRLRNLYHSVFFNIYELKVYCNQLGKLMAKKGKKDSLCDVADNCLALMLFCCFTSVSCPFCSVAEFTFNYNSIHLFASRNAVKPIQ